MTTNDRWNDQLRSAAEHDGDQKTLAALAQNGSGVDVLPAGPVAELVAYYRERVAAALESRSHEGGGIPQLRDNLVRYAESQLILQTLRELEQPRLPEEHLRALQELGDWEADLAPPATSRDLGAPADVREWLVPGWLPAGRVTRFSSHGGSGKSYLALELAAAVATARDPADGGLDDAEFRATWHVGAPVLARTPKVAAFNEILAKRKLFRAPLFRLAECARPQRVLFVSWEDELEEFRRRAQRLPSKRVSHLDKRIEVVSAEGRSPVWAPRGGGHRDTACVLTGFGRWVEARVRDTRPALVVLDPVAAAFFGNENDRGAVRNWLSHLNALARDTKAALLLISHPPKHSTHTYSGSTDWDNGVRAAWTLDPETVPGMTCDPVAGKKLTPRGLALTLTKSNYGRTGARIWVKWTSEYDQGGLVRCSAAESCEAWHEAQRLPTPEQEADDNTPM